MLLPNSVIHLINGDSLGLRQKEKGETAHDEDPGGEEEEDPGPQMAEHGEKRLRYDEGEYHVGADGDEETGCSCLQREYLARYKPAQRAPRPRKRHHEQADE